LWKIIILNFQLILGTIMSWVLMSTKYKHSLLNCFLLL
jgi:hypothetical protein